MRIETLMETVNTSMARIEAKVDAIEAKVDADVKDMAALKNKGSGILIGVAIAAGGIGAGASTFWRWIVGLFV